jgi:hypothetical protein
MYYMVIWRATSNFFKTYKYKPRLRSYIVIVDSSQDKKYFDLASKEKKCFEQRFKVFLK